MTFLDGCLCLCILSALAVNVLFGLVVGRRPGRPGHRRVRGPGGRVLAHEARET